MTESLIYLDNSTAAKPSKESISTMLPYFSEKWGTLTQPHPLGQELNFAAREALQQVYELLGATELDTVISTSSSAEAVNQALLSTYQDITLSEGKNHFIGTTIDEAPSMMSLHRLEAFGCTKTLLSPNSQGIISCESLIKAITPRTALVTISWASGLTGVIQPIAELSEVCRQKNVRFLVESTHILGKLVFNINELKIDFLAFNGEQIHAPKGIGGLYIRQGVKISPFIMGGIEQGGLRAGSVNIPVLVGLGIGAKQTLEARDYLCTEIARLKALFERELIRRIPVKIFFEYEERLPHITAIAFPGVTNEALAYLLNRRGVCASLGGGSQQQISYFLKACGIDSCLSENALSFSLSRETTEEEILKAVKILDVCYIKLRKASSQLIAAPGEI